MIVLIWQLESCGLRLFLILVSVGKLAVPDKQRKQHRCSSHGFPRVLCFAGGDWEFRTFSWRISTCSLPTGYVWMQSHHAMERIVRIDGVDGHARSS